MDVFFLVDPEQRRKPNRQYHHWRLGQTSLNSKVFVIAKIGLYQRLYISFHNTIHLKNLKESYL